MPLAMFFSMHNWFGLILVWVGRVHTSILIGANPDWPVHMPPALHVVFPNVVHCGARNCNFNTIWFNCDRKKWDEIFPCELQAKNWKELNEVINKNFLLEKSNV